MKNSRCVLAVALVLFKSAFCFCQRPNLQKPVKYALESAIFLSNGKTPFWQRANQYGIVPSNSPFLTLRPSLETDYKKDSTGRNRHLFGWGAGVDVVANFGSNTQLLLPQAYVKFHVGKFEIWGGRRREVFGLVADSSLTTGAYSWSGNALPMSKIQWNTLGFVEIPFTNKNISFSSSFSHGWFGNLAISPGYGTRTNDTYLHQKTLFLRLGKPTNKVRLYGGVVHNAMWGNEDKIWNDGLKGWRGFVGVLGGESWASSRVGNHLGSIDFGFDVKGKNWHTTFMRQNIYEAGALYWLRAIPDGLNSLSFVRINAKNRSSKLVLNKILIEFLHTTNQGGDVSDFVLGIFGREDYFNHYLYQQGWSYRSKVIGTPFISRANEAKPTLPANTNSNNTRVYVWHLGATGAYKSWNMISKFSLSQNWGNYGAGSFEGKPLQLSGILEASKPVHLLNGSELKVGLSFDVGQLYYNSLGLYIGIKKSGIW